MKQRITIETLQSGQPAPYADTLHEVRVTFERSPWNNPKGDFVPDYMPEEWVRQRLAGLRCGFVLVQRPKDPFATKLDWLRPLDPKTADQIIENGDPAQSLASIWEFQTSTRFTD